MDSASQGRGLELALAELRGRVRRGLETFQRITGLSAVTSLATRLPGPAAPFEILPPVHPICARRMRTAHAPPCRKRWLTHLRSGRRSPDLITHSCPVGLRCATVPIRLDERLVGLAKLVVDARSTEPSFAAATSILNLAVTGACQDSLILVLSEQVGTLGHRVAALQRACSQAGPPDAGQDPVGAANGNGTLVERALAHLHDHYREPGLSLRDVAWSLGCNPRYLTTCFTKHVGEHMHAYLVGLRVAHACRLLLRTALPIKETSYAAGFQGPAPMARCFRRHVGVSPAEYRRVFAAP